MAKKRTRKIDFTGVETFNRPAEGTHRVKINKIEEAISQNDTDMYKVTYEVIAGASKGCRCIENYPLVSTALWKLKQLLEAIGMKANGRVQVDLDKMEGKTLEIDIKHEDYDGKVMARVQECRKITSADDSDEDDEDLDNEDLDEESEDESDEDESEETEDEEEPEEEEKPKKTKKAKAKAKKTKKTEKPKKSKKAKKKEEPKEEPEEDEDWDDDDDDDWED